jgi:Spy/CpxP family protein refolding chaperone
MKKLSMRTWVTLMASVILVSTTNVFAQKGRNWQDRPSGPGYYCPVSDLSETQQKKIDELRTDHQKNMLKFRNQMGEKNAQLQTLRTAEKADMNAINKTIDEIGSIKTQMMKERENHLQQVRGVLTDSQRTQFDTRRGAGKKGGYGNYGGGCRGPRGAGYGPRGI